MIEEMFPDCNDVCCANRQMFCKKNCTIKIQNVYYIDYDSIKSEDINAFNNRKVGINCV